MGVLDKYLAEGEKMLYTAEGGDTYLGATDRRLIERNEKSNEFKDIAYSHISSVEFKEKKKLILLYLGILAGFIGLMTLIMLDTRAGILVLIVAGVLFYGFVATQKSGLLIHTEKDVIPFDFSGTEAINIVIEINKVIRKYTK